MRRYRVVIASRAEGDLVEITTYIASRSSVATATRFGAAVREFCRGLSDAPHRGRRLARGRRSVGFDRKATIVFRVDGGVVRILRIAYRGRDIERLGDRP